MTFSMLGASQSRFRMPSLFSLHYSRDAGSTSVGGPAGGLASLDWVRSMVGSVVRRWLEQSWFRLPSPIYCKVASFFKVASEKHSSALSI